MQNMIDMNRITKPRLASVSHCRWAFYEALESKDFELMASWFETLYEHYKRRGKRK